MKLFRTDNTLTPSRDLIQPSILLLKQNIWAVLYLALLPGLLSVVGIVLLGPGHTDGTSTYHFDNRSLTGLALILAGTIWTMLALPGYILLQLRATRGEVPEAMECFKAGLPRLLPYMGMVLIAGILIVIGIIALVIPGLILIRGFYLAQYYLIDQKLGPIASLKQSYADSIPNSGYIWGNIGVTMAFGVIGSTLGKIPVIGYLISLVSGQLYAFAPALRYGEIAKHQKVLQT